MSYENQGSEILQFEDYYVRASTGKRFLNYLIDIVVFYIIIFSIGIIAAIINPSIVDYLENDSALFNILDRILSLLLYAVYMGISETVFKGKSIGKFITRTRAVNLDGSNITGRTAFLRGLSRAVPFAAFSAFGDPSNPWQDKWTDTMVVNDIR